MDTETLKTSYDFSGRTVIVTGASGVLCSEMARTLIGCNANVALLGRDAKRAEKAMAGISQSRGRWIAVAADVTQKETLEEAARIVLKEWGRIDCLINGAGGNSPKATTNQEQSFFDLTGDGFRSVFDLNLLGTVLACQVFGKFMTSQKEGIILNIASMNAFRPLTRIPAYSAAKAAVSNFTQWLAVHMAQEYSSSIRVNAVAPGFFLTEQNRFLLTDQQTGQLTPRGKKILDHTPMGRFGKPDDLLGVVLWLLSPLSAFVTGIVVPVDGGFSAYSGV